MTDVLVLCDDLWHPAEVVKRGLRNLKNDTFRFDFVMDAKDILTPEMIAQYPAIICCKGDYLTSANKEPWFTDITEVGAREFESYVFNGGAFLSLHSGNTAKEGSEYGAFVGNYFLGHPPRCKVEVIISGDHAIVRGVKNFSIRDEHYQLALDAHEKTELFRTRSEAGGDQIGGYVRELGKGRLCVMTPGHNLSVWEHPEYQKLLMNALNWCIRQ
ncbi:hypothetical protein AGMMS49587_06700 [Spirochaetia bacterium]|nr:hypothetical protein AGMMS49587_06700 [Spirochaetia bacterium]